MACIYKINGKTFNTTEEIQNYVSSDEFVSVLAKGNSGISKEIRNLILNEEVTEGGVKAPQVTEPALRDVESTAKTMDDFNTFKDAVAYNVKRTADIGIDESEANYGDAQNINEIKSDLEKAGIQVEKVSQSSMSDENYASFDGEKIKVTDENIPLQVLLHEIGEKVVLDLDKAKQKIEHANNIFEAVTTYGASRGNDAFADNFYLYFLSPKTLKELSPNVYTELNKLIPQNIKDLGKSLMSKYGVTEQTLKYNKSKAVESLLSKEQTKNKENAIQKPSTNEEVSRNGETRKNQPESSQGVRQGEQGQEATEKEITTVAEKASITPKNAKDLYKVNRELFGLNKVQALASAITMDRMVGAMAKRAGITKTEMYGRLKFEKDTEENVLKAENALFQGRVNGQDVTLRNIDVDVVNGFYSPIEKRLAETNIEKQSANKWLTSGVIGKGDEAIWTGVKKWLESKNPQEQVSKSEIRQWMKDNRISVVEVVGSEKEGNLPKSPMRENITLLQLEGEKENYKEILVTLPVKKKQVSYTIFKEGNEWKAKDNFTNEIKKGGWKSELEAELWAEGRSGEVYDTKGNFKSSHYDEPNILVHLRMNTRIDAEGNKVLFLEEVQSDWGQEGKKRGFSDTSKQESIINQAKEKINAYAESNEKLGLLPMSSSSEVENFKRGNTEATAQIDKEIARIERYKDTVRNNRDWDAANKEIEKLENEKIEIKKQILANFKGIEEQNKVIDLAEREITKSSFLTPNAPFVTDTNAWTKLGLKAALKEAVKQGADKIAWTTGEQQNDRYSLEKVADEIRYSKNEDGTYRVVAFKNGENVSEEKRLPESKLEATLGKDVAQRIIDGVGENIEGEKSLTGENLKVGGKGMKGFYGSPTEGSLGIVGNVAKSLFKQEPKTVDFSYGKGFRLFEKGTNKFIGKFDGQYTLIDSKGNQSKVIPEDYKTPEQVSKELGYDSKDLKIVFTGEFPDVEGIRIQNSIDITPELRAEVERGLALFQKEQGVAKGAMVAADGRFIIYALTDPNVSTPLHELAHVFEHYLTDAEKLAVKNWAGTKQWDVQTSEKFARGFEKYLAEGKAPNSALEKVFANFKEWLTEIYNGIVGSDIDIELNDDMRELYSKMLGEDFSTQKQEATPQVKEANVKAIEEAMTKKSGTIKNEIIKEAANPTEVKKILDNLDAIKSKLAGLKTKDGDSVFSEECKWG